MSWNNLQWRRNILQFVCEIWNNYSQHFLLYSPCYCVQWKGHTARLVILHLFGFELFNMINQSLFTNLCIICTKLFFNLSLCRNTIGNNWRGVHITWKSARLPWISKWIFHLQLHTICSSSNWAKEIPTHRCSKVNSQITPFLFSVQDQLNASQARTWLI